ncbi:MAG: ATP-binding protein [Ghiorsea sp.]|nr:ATP-binding protein [Ghiorsea sp.]
MGIFSYFNVVTSEEHRPYEYRIQLVNVMLVLSIIVLSFFSMVHLYLGHNLMAIFQISLASIYTFTYFNPLKNVRYEHKESIVVMGTTILFWFLFLDGGIESTGIYWVPFFPFLVFAVAGLQSGKSWVVLFGLGLVTIEVLDELELIALKYSHQETIFFFIAFFFYTVVAALFEALRNRQQMELEEKNNTLLKLGITLNDTLDSLEEEVAKRTFEIKDSNRKLAQEVEEHKQTNVELKKSEQRFYQAQKMEALSTLVAGIAHDFNSLLSGINANLFLMQRKIKDTPQVQDPLDDIEKMVLHASNMTKQLLTYARKDDVEKTQCNLNLFMQDDLKLLNITLPSRIKVEVEITKTPLPVLVSITQIQQVLLNLVNNARDALSRQEVPVIRLCVAHLLEAQAWRNHHPVEGDWAYICIQDNGKGIHAKDLNQVFDPFFTTKATGEGAGLGLAMCYGAMQSHGGLIEVDSSVGKGTTFHVYFPLVQEDNHKAMKPSVHKDLQGCGETILLVDDDDNLRRAQKSVLENLNYTVLLAANGFEAIKVYAGSDVDIVIMDIMMPKMSGIKAAQHILTMDDKAKIIFVSGYDKDSSTERFLRADCAQVERIRRLDKPFTIQQLCRVIHDTLGKL